jgi:alpha-beta hydrolase superfamily lysophospholipase
MSRAFADRPDILGEPYRAEEIPLPDDDEGPVVATLVSRAAAEPTGRAVLHVHGFCDYFFHTALADFWVEHGYDFYAVDLRKYGRSLRPHQTPNFASDLGEYAPELEESLRRVTHRDGHDRLVVSAHSTGALVTLLWLGSRVPVAAGLVLNAPWLDMGGSLFLRRGLFPAIDRFGGRRPYLKVPRSVSGLYGRSIHRSQGGEWDYDLAWKPLESWPVYIGWLRAVRRAQAVVHRGVDVGAPVLMLTSGASSRHSGWHEDVDRTDIVLDVDHMWRWGRVLGPHLTMVRVPGALHDVTLSREPVRARVFEETARWLSAYVDRG